jgi:hypothetical protein
MAKFWELLREFPAVGPIIGAVIGIIGTVLLAPLIAKWIRAKKRLVVALTLSKWKMPERISTITEQMRLRAAEEEKKPDEAETLALAALKIAQSYVLAEVKNKSNTKISHITLKSNRASHAVYQVEDGHALGVVEGTKADVMSVGELQPRHEKRVHIWTVNDLSSVFHHRDLFTVSADELDAVRFKRPIPPYFKEIYGSRIFLIGLCSFLALFFGLGYFGYIHD